MNPTRISGRFFRSYESFDLEIPAGAVAIVGANGSGKSSLVNVIDLCLFGARSFADYLNDEAGDQEMQITLEFEHRGEAYRIRRSFSGRGRGKTSIDFERSDPDGDPFPWEPLTRESAAATQAFIEEVTGLTRTTFRASAFLAQGDSAAFTEAQPRARKEILCDVLGLGVYDEGLAQFRGLRSEIATLTERLAARIEEAERELQRKPDVETQMEAYGVEVGRSELRLREAENAHQNATRRLNESREVTAKLAAAREVLAVRERELGQLTARRRQVSHALEGADEIPKLRAQSQALVDRKPDIEQQLAEAQAGEKARDERRRLKGEIARLNEEATGLMQRASVLRAQAEHSLEERGGDHRRCPTCEQPLNHEAAGTAAAKLNAQADGLEAEANDKLQAVEAHKPQLDDLSLTAALGPNAGDQAKLQADLKVVGEAEKVLAGLEQREKRVEELREEQAEIADALPHAEKAAADQRQEVLDLQEQAPTEDLEAAVARAYSDLAERRADVEANKRKVAVAEADLVRLEGIEALAAENRRVSGHHQDELDLLALAERAYGRDGIPALVLENAAIPQIEAEACRILAELGTDFRVELRTQRELKSRAGLAEALDIVVLSPAGERPYETFSGGERTRLNLALRIALARLLANRRGAEVRMLAIDEPDGLDAAGFAALSSILRGMSADFDSIICISHHPDLATAFDQTLRVVKDEGGSHVEGLAAPAEAVTV